MVNKFSLVKFAVFLGVFSSKMHVYSLQIETKPLTVNIFQYFSLLYIIIILLYISSSYKLMKKMIGPNEYLNYLAVKKLYIDLRRSF